MPFKDLLKLDNHLGGIRHGPVNYALTPGGPSAARDKEIAKSERGGGATEPSNWISGRAGLGWTDRRGPFNN